MNKTPLNHWHREHGAKMIDFGGWEMPVSYEGILAEHHGVRQACGLFDICHMGEIEIKGAGAWEMIQSLTSNDVRRLADGQAQYSLLMNSDGYAIDDILVYRRSADHVLLCVNAANTEKDLAHLLAHARPDAQIIDLSADTALLALQGPASVDVLRRLGVELNSVPRFHTLDIAVAGVPVLFSRTGYTGEAGCELFFPAAHAVKVWELLLAAGADAHCRPIGLAARDTLRLEMGYVLYGHELSESITPLEAGLEWVIRWDAGDFLGKSHLQAQKQAGLGRQVVGLKLLEKGIPREGMNVVAADQPVGRVLSGTLSPMLQQGIATALIDRAVLSGASEFFVDIRGKMKKAQIIKPPFIQRG